VDGELVNTAVNWLAGRIESGPALPQTCDRPLPAGDNDKPAGKAASASGYALPLEAIDRAVDAAGALPFGQGLALEQTLFDMLVARPESAALRYAFFAEHRAATIDDPLARTVRAREIGKTGIVGAGTMGAGIAICFANAGMAVLLFDAKPDSLERGITSIRAYFEQQVAKGRLAAAEAARRAACVTPVTEIGALGSSDLVIEAVFEDLDVKRDVLSALDAVLHPGAILATNTSTLDVNAIAAFTARPADVVGLHFFSPAPAMKLLEIVRGAATAPDVLVTAQALARRLGKVGVVSGVCDGFIGNRMWHQYLRQAARVVELGATPQQVDHALERWGFAMGPFRVADLAGLDVGYLIRQRQQREFPDMRWPAWLDHVSETGRLGQKGGCGIYRYDTGRRGEPDAEVEALIAASCLAGGVEPRVFTDHEIVEWCTHALIVEGARLLEEGIAQRGSDVDAVFLNGYGFPRHRGGPLFHADALGLYNVMATLRDHSRHEEPGFWQAPALLLDLAAQKRKLSGFTQGDRAAAGAHKETFKCMK
jgi:3-hydroxyacyl-CoA dehydrogenase